MGAVKQNKTNLYQYHFDQINGEHPLKKINKDSYIDYPARLRKGGKLRYFNFELARQMGLIPIDHPDELRSELEKSILDTFSLIIINEYDQMNNRYFPKEEIKSEKYMATRYLQLQHQDKTGRTSGDGRSIWNGIVQNGHKLWDVSSCGTGATALSPATSKHNKFFKSGDPSISYGCGYSEIDEGVTQAIFSEVFHQNKMKTERTLALIEFEKGYSINVRAHECLLRPSHFFMYLKQGKREELKKLLDYYIERQIKTKNWKPLKVKDRYSFFLNKIVDDFSKTAADFESHYVFCWLDWDGDNILMDGSLLDYGSIRQFGMFHHEYRYDDIERMSTNILEQRDKAKYIVQSFIQLVDFVETKKKKKISDFKSSSLLESFDRQFEKRKFENLLKQIGYNKESINFLIEKKNKLVQDFYRVFSHFERAKSSRGLVKVSDGVCWDAIFCMRDILRELPQIYMNNPKSIKEKEFISILKSRYANKEDLVISDHRKKMIRKFQELYKKMIFETASYHKKSLDDVLLEISLQSSVLNKEEKVTGDSITIIVQELMKKRKRNSADKMYRYIYDFSLFQSFSPQVQLKNKLNRVVKKFLRIVKDYREGI